MPTRNLAIMFTDVKGFTARVSRAKREDLKHLLSVHEHLLAPVIQHFEGTIVKTIGDSFLARFDNSTDAVLCGVTIQEVLRQHNTAASEEERLDVRVAINAGDVELIDGDVMGESVNLASRLEGIAEAGEVYFTESVYLAMNRREAPSAEIGERTFAGIPYPVRVYKVIQDPNSELAQRLHRGVQLTGRRPVLRGLHETLPRVRSRRRTWATVAGAGAMLTAALLYHVTRPPPEGKQTTTRQADTAVRETQPQPKETTTPTARDDQARRQAALETGRKQVEQLRQTQGAGAALEWLRKRLDQSPELEPLRAQVPTLDALAVAETIISGDLGSNEKTSMVKNLLARYPKSAEVPLALARTIEGKVTPASYPLELYRAAIERGADPRDRRIFELSTRLFSRYWPGQIETAHDLLQRHFGEEAVAWARRALDTDESGAILQNAWTILRDRKDAKVGDAYYLSLNRLIHGYENEEEADHDLRIFQEANDPVRRSHILGVHRWVLKPLAEKGVNSFGYSHRELAERNLARLKEAWEKP